MATGTEDDGQGAPTSAERLRTSPIDVVGRMPWSSNATFLVRACDEHGSFEAVYKPAGGERPLHDFRPGLYRREVASFELSEALEWGLVPTTVERDDLPLGPGSLQELVETDYDRHYFTIVEEGVDEAHRHALHQIVVFDVLSNQTDRKSGHVIEAADGRLLLIDNGLSFHALFKLRTVMWDFAGEAIPADILDDVAALLDRGLPSQLAALLDPIEVDAVGARGRALLASGRFPIDPSGRAWPWPLV